MYGPVFLPASVNAIQHVAVSVQQMGHVQNHAALLFKNTKGKLQVLELRVNADSGEASIDARDHVDGDPLAWAVPRLHPRLLKSFARDCQSIASKPVRLMYGFRFTELTRLSKTQVGWSITSAVGATCATLILALFQNRNHPLVEASSWQPTADDEKWQADFHARIEIGLMGRGMTREERAYVDANRSDIPCARFLPQDVVGSCRCKAHPSSFNETREAGAEISAWIRALPK